MRLRSVLSPALLVVLCSTPAVRALDNDHDGDDVANVVYIHSNNPTPGTNAAPGYKRSPVTGELSEMPASPFPTGGTGFYNNNERLGPDDTDQEIVATRDHQFLYTVNQGSNTIAGF